MELLSHYIKKLHGLYRESQSNVKEHTFRVNLLIVFEVTHRHLLQLALGVQFDFDAFPLVFQKVT